MLRRHFARTAGIARTDGIDKRAVLLQCRLETPGIRHGNRAKTRQLLAQIADDREQALVARCLIEQLVKLNVRLHDTLHIVLLDRASDGNQEAFQPLLLLLRDALCRQLTRQHLKCGTDLEDLVDVTDGDTRHVGAAPWDGDDVAFLLQLANRLAHGGTADEQLIGKIVLLQPLARLQDTAANRIAQHLTDDLAQRLITVDHNRR